MKPISTKTHGKLDYLTGLVLVSSPWIFHYASSDQYFIWIPFALGSLIIVYSMLTKYELGFFPAIGMKVHLLLDLIGGVFLAISPWILAFNDVIFWPHLVIGIAIVVIAFASERKYYIDKEIRVSDSEETTESVTVENNIESEKFPKTGREDQPNQR